MSERPVDEAVELRYDSPRRLRSCGAVFEFVHEQRWSAGAVGAMLAPVALAAAFVPYTVTTAGAATLDNVDAAAEVTFQAGGTILYHNPTPVDVAAVRAIQSD